MGLLAAPKGKIKLKLKLFNMGASLSKFVMRLFGRHNENLIRAKMIEEFVPRITVQTKFGPLRFFCPSCSAVGAAKGLLTYEPATIEWIEGFEKGSVFWDIGANIGTFSLYAAYARQSKVIAFEPFVYNYYVLTRNIEENKLDDKISAYCIALWSQTALDYFYLSKTAIGSGCHAFTEKEQLPAAFKHAMIGYAIDDFISKFNPPFPNYLKIDVDGYEDRVIDGAMGTLSDQRLKSVLAEIYIGEKAHFSKVRSTLEESGFEDIKAVKKDTEAGLHNNYIFSRGKQ